MLDQISGYNISMLNDGLMNVSLIMSEESK